MKIIVTLRDIMAEKKMSLFELAEKTDLTNVDLSCFIKNRMKSIEFSTLASICKELDCQPGDILKYVDE